MANGVKRRTEFGTGHVRESYVRYLLAHGESLLSVVTRPTPVQKRAFQLLGVKLDQNVPIRLLA